MRMVGDNTLGGPSSWAYVLFIPSHVYLVSRSCPAEFQQGGAVHCFLSLVCFVFCCFPSGKCSTDECGWSNLHVFYAHFFAQSLLVRYGLHKFHVTLLTRGYCARIFMTSCTSQPQHADLESECSQDLCRRADQKPKLADRAFSENLGS